MSTQDAERLRAGLDEDEAREKKLLAEAQRVQVAIDQPGILGRYIPGWHTWPEVEAGCERALADIAAKRHILARYENAVRGFGAGSVSAQALGYAVAALAAVYREPAEDGTPAAHTYLSTSCLHATEPGREELHTYCQSTTGSNGTTQWAKAPASCKFCGAPCTCPCHTTKDAPG